MAGALPAEFIGRSHPYLETDEVADLLNRVGGKNVWDSQKVRRWLQRSGAVRKVGGRWRTTRDQLRDAFPEMWEAVLRMMPEEAEEV